MEKYKKLLESTVPEDIALGLFLMYREGKLVYGDLASNCTISFVVQLDEYSIWNDTWSMGMGTSSRLLIRSRLYDFIGNVEFDFRTKTEEND